MGKASIAAWRKYIPRKNAAPTGHPLAGDGGTESTRTVNDAIESVTKESHFFESNPPGILPVFLPSEIAPGTVLGHGQFGAVREVQCVELRKGPSAQELLRSELFFASSSNLDCLSEPLTPKRKLSFCSEHQNKCTDSFNKGVVEARAVLRAQCRRGGKARYAVKRLRSDLQGENRYLGALDMATEAKFLASLSHPNIVKLRATVGVPGHQDFMLVLDRLFSTLEAQISTWRAEQRRTRGFFGLSKRSYKSCSLLSERLYAAYDIARALNHLHEHNIIHRDLKPENVAYDIRGNIRVFDLGLARELTPKDLIRTPEDYDCTGLTGSRRWMAPEVHLCLPYGPSVDVYSFGLTLWSILSLKTPFGEININDHFNRVVKNNERPPKLKYVPSNLEILVCCCWEEDRSKRPSFKRICSKLQSEIMELENEERNELFDRTTFLNDKSNNSLRDASISNFDELFDDILQPSN